MISKPGVARVRPFPDGVQGKPKGNHPFWALYIQILQHAQMRSSCWFFTLKLLAVQSHHQHLAAEVRRRLRVRMHFGLPTLQKRRHRTSFFTCKILSSVCRLRSMDPACCISRRNPQPLCLAPRVGCFWHTGNQYSTRIPQSKLDIRNPLVKDLHHKLVLPRRARYNM